MGKSTLLTLPAERARDQGLEIDLLDAGSIEPTPAAFADCLAERGGLSPPREDGAAGDGHDTRILAIDNFEALELLETWFRQRFVPQLPATARIILASCRPPGPGWHLDLGVQGVLRTKRLDVLSEEDSKRVLDGYGLPPRQVDAIANAAKGHPLTMVLAAARALDSADGRCDQAITETSGEISKRLLDASTAPEARAAVQAAAMVRRLNQPLLRALLPEADADDALSRLRDLPFVEPSAEGLTIHDAVRGPVATTLQSEDPERYRQLRVRAWRHLRQRQHDSTDASLWEQTADTIYLLRNPVIREAFFPTQNREGVVEQALPDDVNAIVDIARAHEPNAVADLIAAQATDAHHHFHVMRWPNGVVGGFYWAYDPTALDVARMKADGIAVACWRDLTGLTEPRRGQCLFIRRWLSRRDGEAPSPVQAQMWLDMKRLYMQMRPNLRWVYITLRDVAPYAAVAEELGFELIDASPVIAADGTAYSVARLDMGQRSFDGWIDHILTREIGDPEADLLDARTRELCVGGARVALTPTELSVMRLLCTNAGMPVSREELLRAVWGERCESESNVVDVVVAALRRKLGDQAGRIRTVRGIGYAYRE